MPVGLMPGAQTGAQWLGPPDTDGAAKGAAADIGLESHTEPRPSSRHDQDVKLTSRIPHVGTRS